MELLPTESQKDRVESRTILDAGGATWAMLTGPIYRRFEDMATGEILEIITPEPSMVADAAEWCRLTGHELVQTLAGGDSMRFFIRRREPG